MDIKYTNKLFNRLIRLTEYYLKPENIIIKSESQVIEVVNNYLLSRALGDLKAIKTLIHCKLELEAVLILKNLIEVYGDTNLKSIDLLNQTCLGIINAYKEECTRRNNKYTIGGRIYKTKSIRSKITEKKDTGFNYQVYAALNLIAHNNILALISITDDRGDFIVGKKTTILTQLIVCFTLFYYVNIFTNVVIVNKKEYNNTQYYLMCSRLVKDVKNYIITIIDIDLLSKLTAIEINKFYKKRIRILKRGLREIKINSMI
ncbi:hypothetical protein A500_01175 [Clostridium sartagoforme AAU1]|jgi:hypothetical protein|uniref:Uncharacterized protein n=1 Tax=Clostridium sartagoforme AAU1 TaxID=1202534 RepID=R9CFM3_9CLOT|nr:hypothetical protein [Clostridium sartagoforme]EOR28083.1 hypothetical protein A500_01175 [Clostridium sartagoforme AAU1]